MNSNNVIEALEMIRLQHEGVLHPEHVVENARDEESPLHEYFEWDDGTAADRYRIYQARILIRRLKVTRPATNGTRTVRLYVSLTSDRMDQGGYRQLDEVLRDEQQRLDLLATALGEFEALQRKYADLEQLSPLFAAIADAAQRFHDKGGDAPESRA